MDGATGHLYCVNGDCQQPNPAHNRFCQACQTPLMRRYLWAIGEPIPIFTVGSVLGDRYQAITPRIVLDLHPYLPPQMPEDNIPGRMLPYLKLIGQQLHLPQLYGQLTGEPEVWLLEVGNLRDPVHPVGDHLLPQLQTCWARANALRQAAWLWQLARLWDSCQAEGVASTLLTVDLLQVNGPVVRLRELQFDSEPVTLAQLGQLWATWVSYAATPLRDFLRSLCQQLQTGQLATAEQLIETLDRAIATLGQGGDRAYQIFAQTDAGPSRDHNEDACYPQDLTTITAGETKTQPLLIVCDGIGGHEGGEVASAIAIDTMQDHLHTAIASNRDRPWVDHLQTALEQAILQANDQICQRNDDEERHERQRMGTTLVSVISHAPHLYLGHVGDSRIYWITRSGCYQISLDDDVAAREVRLGYALYRDAVSFPGGGALVQALGMGSRDRLYPTVDRLVLDEDSLLLLCSDGLSDYDRVEQYWQTELLPVLHHQQELQTAVQRLVALANQKNGHDNVTVGLFHCQFRPHPQGSPILAPLPVDVAPDPVSLSQPTALSRPRHGPPLMVITTVTVALVLMILGGLSYWLFPELRQWTDRLTGNTPVTAESPQIPLDQLELGVAAATLRTLAVQPDPRPEAETLALSPQTVIIVTRRQAAPNQQTWLQLQLCNPTVNQPAVVWVERDRIQDTLVAPLTPPPRCVPAPENLIE
ncbi:protein phosphatase 2C domain-containing protein [Spirulina major CS-329]|uniref:PP2C family serine/threonine-protein phosphatase n=1 Tax=Spirulina TaxID=1154 RepID=UPI0023315625|nr:MULTISPECIES: protein phosphatase 2C domain-containing protein [Spirulina]MDB9493483.1 protein phosphatase 2C domain-containing protein [Spirulina subsalsa CS-330]MDB9502576.1 protein phosphatase 2C domain-containing protein [Spirulina major CS-329]